MKYTDLDYTLDDVTVGPAGGTFRNAGHPMYRRLTPAERDDLAALIAWLQSESSQRRLFLRRRRRRLGTPDLATRVGQRPPG